MSRTLHFDKLAIGGVPRVVGAISQARTLSSAEACQALELDIAEFRLDMTGFVDGWKERAREFRAAGKPVLLTLRYAAERGQWTESETARQKAYEDALGHVSAVDVEVRSEILHDVVRAAHASGKPVIASFHDFDGLPSPAVLHDVIGDGIKAGADIVKLAVRTDQPEALLALEGLLASAPRDALLCVVGMGLLGPESRVRLARSGSCLTYGYADETNAPGQLSSAELLRRLHTS